jgi:hypothetical protein
VIVSMKAVDVSWSWSVPLTKVTPLGIGASDFQRHGVVDLQRADPGSTRPTDRTSRLGGHPRLFSIEFPTHAKTHLIAQEALRLAAHEILGQRPNFGGNIRKN